MSDLSIPEANRTIEKETPTGVMLVTMLLLIGGLLLTSTMMAHYTLGSKNMDGDAPFSLSDLIQKGKAYTAQTAASDKQEVTPAPDTPKTKKARINLFSFGKSDKIKWPKLKLTGFGRSADSQGSFAIINNKPVHLNQEIGEVTLVEIRTHDVIVEYRGERKTLSVVTR